MKKNKLVFDTGPLLLYFAGDKQVEVLFNEINADRAEGYTSELNLAELYYKMCAKFGRKDAEVRITSFRFSKILTLPIDDQLTREAGYLKCTYGDSISLVDAYILALAKRLKGTLITTDYRLAKLKLVQTRLIQIP
uniref:Type II toxin-antitoxin system VapC family toxin n=1 Tax=Thermofilum adornatum TaxID=1365176 RepID=A0A7C1GP81_9CREN